MNLNQKINENTILYFIEAEDFYTDENDKTIVNKYQLSFGFYDCHYDAYIKKNDLDSSDGDGCITISGDEELFESFESLCENKHWELIKKKCIEYQDYLNSN